MKYLLNQRGYALLIVMLTIIIFLSLSAVFMSSSLNHVTQERTVDTNNQAVTAAEMGLQQISKDIKNELLVAIPVLEADYIKSISKINSDYLNGKVNLVNSKNLLSVENSKYYVNVLNEINSIDTTGYSKPINSTNLTAKQVIEPNTKTYFYLNSRVANVVNANNQFNITVDVNGVKGKEKNIVADIDLKVPRAFFNNENRMRYIKEPNFNVSEFFKVPTQLCQGLISMSADDLNNLSKPIECLLPQNTTFDITKNFIEKMYEKGLTEKDFNLFIENFEQALCNSSNCNSNPFRNMDNTTLFILGDVPAKNINKSGGFQLYVNGIIDLKNANSYGDPNIHTVMLGKSLEVQKLIAENSTFVLMGNDTKDGFYRGELTGNGRKIPELTLTANSKACINIEGFNPVPPNPPLFPDLSSIRNFETIVGGKVYYFKNDATEFNKDNKANYFRVNSLNELYETCNLTKFYSAEELGILKFDQVKYN